MTARAVFDQLATTYDEELNAALAVTGESKAYFARSRIALTLRQFNRHKLTVRAVLDFGCGVGDSCKHWAELAPWVRYTGVDESQASIDIANRKYACGGREFLAVDKFQDWRSVDLVYSNGVFHH